ncbi:Secretory carrier-associated membrane protein 1 [Vitis vinifera]|uniref:Secretory carrier-associated membrane protein n=1 Tax=Vitis vinifera TaxID=29760 RepID=A0A438JI33_VITVI|nr:Secretory carrier-associated membrane protein 1 [Vitis vinifera]
MYDGNALVGELATVLSLFPERSWLCSVSEMVTVVVALCNSCGSGILMVVVLQQKGVREGGIGMLEATTSFWIGGGGFSILQLMVRVEEVILVVMGQASNIDGFGDELWYKCGVAMLVKVATVWVMVKIMTVNPGSVPPAANSRLSPLPPEPAGYRGATVDIPLDGAKDTKAKERELQAKEAELKKREQELKRREDAVARAGIVIEEKNWPPFFPLIHHDIANEIPIHQQKLQFYPANYVDEMMFMHKIVVLTDCHLKFWEVLVKEGLVLCLTWNIVAVTTAWIKGEGPTIWFLAIIYFYQGFQELMCCGIVLFIVP